MCLGHNTTLLRNCMLFSTRTRIPVHNIICNHVFFFMHLFTVTLTCRVLWCMHSGQNKFVEIDMFSELVYVSCVHA